MINVTPAKLILDPTGATPALSGGTELARLDSIQQVSLGFDVQGLQDPAYGSSPVDAAITGIDAGYAVKFMDSNTNALSAMTNRLGLTWLEGGGTYKLGQILANAQYLKLLLRPVDKAGAVVATKPFAFFPRALVVSPINLTFARQAPHAAAFNALILGFTSRTLGRPLLYGAPANWPTDWEDG